MKQVVFWIVVGVLTCSIQAQQTSTYIFNSEQGWPFKVLLNGITQNENPMSKVIIKDVSREASSMKAKFIFEDENLGEIKAQLWFESGKILFYEIQGEDRPTACVEKGKVEESKYTGDLKGAISYKYIIPDDSSHIDEPIQTTVILKINEFGELEQLDAPANHAGDVIIEPGILDYTGPTGCEYPMAEEIAIELSNTLKALEDDQARITFLKKELTGKCFTVAQCGVVISDFQSESHRLEAAKVLYTVLWDRANVSRLQHLFTSSADWDGFMNYINYYQGR